KLDPVTFGSHADIAPTLFNLALSEKTYYGLGRNLFDAKGDYAVNASNLIVDRTGGVLVGATREKDHNLDWEGDYARLVPGPDNEHKKDLSTKYKSLMGVLDYYFMKEKQEKKGQSSHANPSR
ncbi:MAG: LTA synthase family protein, partial [Bdellovibrio sp.]|nr:LTA synthase family protein [Bdellovibrio sp.]